MIPNERLRALTRAALGAALLCIVPAACSSTGSSSDTEAGLSDSSSKSADEKGGDKAHEVAMAELALDQARLESEQGLAKAELEVMTSERKLTEAKQALQVFKKSKARRQAEAQLALDRATGQAADAEAELAELEAMYAEEEFAEKTKELVLTRGRRNLDHARRGLEIQEQKLAQLVEFDLPKEQSEKDMAVTEAESKLGQAQRSLELAKIKGKSGVAKAEHALMKARTKKDKED